MIEQKNILRKSIIERVGKMNSVWGLVASGVEDEKQEEELINILYEEADIKSFQEYLGKELFNDVINYNVKYNNKKKIDLIN